jgi:transposase
VTPGSNGADSKCTTQVTPGSNDADSKCTTQVTAGSAAASDAGKPRGERSACADFADVILKKMEAGLSAQRIYQDLVAESAFSASYQSVKRYVARQKATAPQRFERIETEPGEEVQVDFGLGAMIEQPGGKAKRSWVLRMVLSYSRKGYSEAVLHQNTENFLRAIENGFRSFGGVPLILNLDNLKAAVLQADWHDPEINPKMADFCRFYSISVMPCRPGVPRHKGKVERGVDYVRQNALKGRRFPSLHAENDHLQQWESHTADKRIHGTTRRQVAALFEEERPQLQALPAGLFPSYQEARRTVGRDSYVEVARAYYEVPPEYIGNKVWVRWDSRTVRVLNLRNEQVAMHCRIEAGKFSRSLHCAGMSAPVSRSCRYWLERIQLLGVHCEQWALQAFEERGAQALRSLRGLWELSKKHPTHHLEEACRKAIANDTRRLKDIKRLVEQPRGGEQRLLDLGESHPLIRELGVYGEFIHENQNKTQPPAPCQTTTLKQP